MALPSDDIEDARRRRCRVLYDLLSVEIGRQEDLKRQFDDTNQEIYQISLQRHETQDANERQQLSKLQTELQRRKNYLRREIQFTGIRINQLENDQRINYCSH